VTTAAVPGGRAYLAWSDGSEAYLLKSIAQGSLLEPLDFGQDATTYDRYPEVCAQGDQVVVLWSARRPGSSEITLFANVSEDGGATFGPPVDLRPSAPSQFAFPSLACDGNGNALAVWRERRDGSPYRLRRSRFHDGEWNPEEVIAAQPAEDVYADRVTFVDAAGSVAIAVYVVSSPGEAVYVSRSTDGGVNFDSFQRLDLTAPDPSARDEDPKIVSDHAGRVWVMWMTGVDISSSYTVVVSGSTDEGQTFSPVTRVSSELPPHAKSNHYDSRCETPAALPGVGLFLWSGQRNSYASDALFNRDVHDEDVDGSPVDEDCNDLDPSIFPGAPQLCDGLNNDCLDAGWPTPPADEVTDTDSDGRVDCGDCAPSDPTAQDPPVEVEDLFVSAGGPTEVHWSDAGEGYEYDIAGGMISELSADGGLASAVCLADGLTSPNWSDVRSDPSAGTGYYYVVRMLNACGIGTFGTDSTENERIPTLSCP
jgi:hypothetical protein